MTIYKLYVSLRNPSTVDKIQICPLKYNVNRRLVLSTVVRVIRENSFFFLVSGQRSTFVSFYSRLGLKIVDEHFNFKCRNRSI